MAQPADERQHPSWTSPRVVATIAGAAIASMGASTLGAGSHSPALSLTVIGIGLAMVIESVAEGRRPLRTWGVVLAALGVTATIGPLAATLGGGSAAGVMYFIAGLTAAIVEVGDRA